MEFDLPCECRKVHRVSIGLAGTSISCDCGRQIPVPSSLKLREMAGLAPVEPEPELVLRQLVETGELPPPRCVVCSAEAATQIPLLVECERQFARARDNDAAIYGLLLGAAGPLLVAMASSVVGTRGRNVETFGRDVFVPAPLSACNACAAQIRPRRVGRVLKVLALICGIAGIVLLILWRIQPALGLFGGSIALRLAARSRRSGEQTRLRQLICRMPEYNDLFRKYPRATIQI